MGTAVSLEEFNLLKAELEQTKLALQTIQQETQSFKHIVLDHASSEKEQHAVTQEFVREKLILNSETRIPIHDMSFELIEYGKDGGCIIPNWKVKSLLEAHEIHIQPCNGEYYYIGVELKDKLNNINEQSTILGNMITHYQNDVNGQIELLKLFLKSHCRTALGSRISAKELNEKVYAFSLKKGIPIKKTEVKSLVTSEPFNLISYTSTGGIASYRDLEFIPMDLNQVPVQRTNLPSLQTNANSPRNGSLSPAPVMMSRQS